MRFSDDELRAWLSAQSFPSKRLTYRLEEVTTRFVLFAPTPSTGRVMLPFELVKEWLEAFESRKITIQKSPREMRIVVQEKSGWANQLHSFETHLAAVVHRWSTDGLS